MALVQASSTAWSTASGGVDIVQLLDVWNSVLLYNRSATQELFYRADGVDPITNGDNSKICLPGEIVVVNMLSPSTPEVRIISSLGIPYGVEGFT